MVKHPNGIVGGDFDNMTTAQWFNYHIEYSTFDDDPLPEGDYPIRPVPNDLDRTSVSFRDVVQYGLWCFGPNYERLTEEEYEALKQSDKDNGDLKLNKGDDRDYKL
jgi:hypothetical protein